MKRILTFEFEQDDDYEFNIYKNAIRYFEQLGEVDALLRQHLKYGDLDDKTSDILENVRDLIDISD